MRLPSVDQIRDRVLLFLPGSKAADAHKDAHGHVVMPIDIYVLVWVLLLFLTAVTVFVSYAGLGPLSIPAALTIAVVKAGFVVGFFMHLKFDTRFNSLVFFSSLMFVCIFFGLTMSDLLARGDSVREADTFFLRDERSAVESSMEAAQEATETDTVVEEGGHGH